MADEDGRDEKDISSRDTSEGGRGRRSVVQYNLLGLLHSTGFVYTARSKCGSWIVVFHVVTLLDLDREAVGALLRVWVVVFLVALAERLGGGGGVVSN